MKRSSKRSVELLALAAGCVVAALLTAPALAQKPFLDKIRKKYNLDKSNGTCALCHDKKPNEEESRKNLNAFGKAIQADPDMKPLLGKDGEFKFSEQDLAVVEKIVVKLENLDTDGDGVSNREELDLSTLPADKKSVPEKFKLTQYRKKNPPVKAPEPAAKTPPAKK